jgi:hypothetical protein
MEFIKHLYNEPMNFHAPYNPQTDQMFIIDYIIYKFDKKLPKTYLTYAPSRDIAQRKAFNHEKGERISFIKIWGCFAWQMQELAP